MFDLRTLKVLDRPTATVDCDPILYDPASKHVFTVSRCAPNRSSR